MINWISKLKEEIKRKRGRNIFMKWYKQQDEETQNNAIKALEDLRKYDTISTKALDILLEQYGFKNCQ